MPPFLACTFVVAIPGRSEFPPVVQLVQPKSLVGDGHYAITVDIIYSMLAVMKNGWFRFTAESECVDCYSCVLLSRRQQ